MSVKNSTTISPLVTEEDFKRISPSKEHSVCKKVRFTHPEDDSIKLVGTFQILDGFAFGTAEIDGEEREVVAQYPVANLVNKKREAEGMKKRISEFLEIEEDRDLTVQEIFTAVAQFQIIDKK